MLQDLVAQLIAAVGLQGVSTVALVLLVSVALYAHKAASAGQSVVYVGSTVTHDLKVISVVLAALLLLGVASLDVQRGQELIQMAMDHLRRAQLLEQARRWVR